jgi:Uncharacterized protein conserved in bacteria (DUF2188)
VPKKHDVHVSTTPNGRWKVTQNSETLSTHRTQGLADQAARREAIRDGVDRVTHGRGGKIRSKDSYGNDSNPPRDTEH